MFPSTAVKYVKRLTEIPIKVFKMYCKKQQSYYTQLQHSKFPLTHLRGLTCSYESLY